MSCVANFCIILEHLGVIGARVEALRAGGLTASARRLAAACARGLRKRAAAAAARWARAMPAEPGPSSGSGPRAAAIASHTDPAACSPPATAAPAPVGTCALTYNDRCLAQGIIYLLLVTISSFFCFKCTFLCFNVCR